MKQITFKADLDLYEEFYAECIKQNKKLSECLRDAMKLWVAVNKSSDEDVQIKVEKGPSLAKRR